MWRLAILICLFAIPQCIIAQIYNNPGGTITTCSGTFFDSGGTATNYASSETTVTTFCSANPGEFMSVNFNIFDIEANFDFLTIYNGLTTASLSLGTFTGTVGPGTVISTDPSGCLTFEFISDGSVTDIGWDATLSCFIPGACTGVTPNCSPAIPDNCASACDLGTLTSLPTCGVTTSVLNIFCLSNVGATAENPYNALGACDDGNDMPIPAADVWYSFVATGNEMSFTITGAIADPSIGLYEGTDCTTFFGRGCNNGTGGAVTLDVDGINAGQTYYLQISGGDETDQGDFSLAMTSTKNCDDCLLSAEFSVTPPPVNNLFNPGDNVTFCYTITEWNQTAVNWIHAVVPAFSEGWDLTTLTPVSATPLSCDGTGAWIWQNTILGTNGTAANPGPIGPGYVYDSSLGGALDGDGGNNFGDNCQGIVNFEFCWSISVDANICSSANTNLAVDIDTYGDSETGSWTNAGCLVDPVYNFSAAVVCCAPGIIATAPSTCAGANDGSITMTGSGQAPYDYVWSGPENGTQTNEPGAYTETGLTTGTYAVSITDDNGCQDVQNITVADPPAIFGSIDAGDITCNGDADGTLILDGGGGTPPYVFTWSNGFGGPAQSGVSGGIYSITITDANMCTFTTSAEVIEPDVLLPTATGTVVPCNDGNSSGDISLTVTGGTTPYTFNWDNGAGTAQNPTGLAPGIYNVTVTDANMCTAATSAEVLLPPALTASATGETLLCAQDNNGDITLTVGGGTPGYTFQWNNGGGFVQNPTNLPPGIYTATVTDANMCTITAQATIDAPLVLSTVTASGMPPTCNNGCDGTVTVTEPTGGTPPYTYTWSDGLGTGQTIAGTACAGGVSYTVTVSDANSCAVISSVSLFNPPPMATTVTPEGLVCDGNSDGTATISVTNGTAPFDYVWDDGMTIMTGIGPTITNLPSGNYDLTITDVNGCMATTSMTIQSAPEITATAAQDSGVSCNGESDGTATVTVITGTPAYTYNWDNGESGATATMLNVGTHTVTITDMNGCIGTTDVLITEPPILTLAATLNQDASCTGDTDGSATATAAGGTPNYTYDWDNGESGATATMLDAGIHTVTVTDVNGCIETTTITIGDPAPLTASGLGEGLLCNGDTDGDITLTVNGGTTPYMFNWTNGGGTDQNPSGLGAGVYDVVVTDANGCITTSTAEITEPTLLGSSVSQDNSVLCTGEVNGAATVNASGGTPPYSYNWDNGETTASATMLDGGLHDVTITDNNGCIVFASITIGEPGILTSSATGVALLCNGETGDISLTVNGGTTPYTFVWTNGAGTDQNPTGLGAGTYDVVVTDANGCTATATADITEPAALTASATGEGLSCNGDTDGDISLTVNGGTTPYTFQWDNGAGTDQNPTGLGVGTYSVTVTDANACVIFATADITEPTALTASATGEALSCNGETDGDISLTVNGGTTPYTFQWDNGAGTDQNPTGLGLGTYNVTVTDANACVIFATADITEPTELTASATGVALLCNGETGDISLTVNGGTTPYTFVWTNGAGTDQNPTGLGAGTYDVVVTDANGCTATATADITEPTALTASATGEALSCNGDTDGDISLTVNGGTTPYTFQWDNGAGTDQNPTGLGANTYTVTVTDANSCTITASADITEPTALTATAVQDSPVSCPGVSDGQATVTLGGGTTPYTYEWDNSETTATATMLGAGAHDVTITDANNCVITASVTIDDAPPLNIALDSDSPANCTACDGSAAITIVGGAMPYTYNWSNGNSTEDPTDLCSSLNTITVTDANGCTAILDVNIGSISTLAATALVDNDVTCFSVCDGQASVTASAGTPPYTYVWSDNQTTPVATNLCAGGYSVTITDVANCVVVETITITEPTELLANAVEDSPVSCALGTDGQATVTATDGTPGYTYNWDNGESTATATMLTGGSHTVTVTDANACTVIANVNITEPAALTTSATGEALLCNGDTDGDITLTVNGGTMPYTYQWDNGAGTDPNPTGIGANTYTVTVTDANSCTITASADITEPTALTATAVQDSPVSCPGETDGQATVTLGGGTTPYTYEWDNSETTATATMLGAGAHDVTITDANNCVITASVTIDDAAPLGLVLDSDTPANCTSCDGTAGITINGGTMPYTYTWSNGNSTEDPTDLCSGINAVTVTDANGCSATLDVNIGTISTLTATTVADNQVTCFSDCNGQATVTASSGAMPYAYQWSDSQTTATATNLCAGTYSVTVTDANNCVVVESVIITEPTELTATANVDASGSCAGGNNGGATVTAVGGTPGYTYNWDNGEMTASATSLSGGAHDVTVTDANNCIVITSVTIAEPDPLVASATGETLLCNGDTGTLTSTITGGTTPYTYQWDNGAGTDPNPTGIGAGTYIITVTDANNCAITASADITEPTALTASAVEDAPVSCTGQSDGQATATAGGGTPPYTYLWDNNETTATATMLSAGVHDITITDANSCIIITNVSITDPDPITVTLDNDTPANCTSCNGGAGISVLGGNAPYTYNWSGGATIEDPIDLCSGTNTVTVTDANGCTATLDVSIGNISTLIASAAVDNDVSCFGACDGQATAAGTSGNPPYSFVWSNGQGTDVAVNLCAGAYTVTVTDVDNCIDIATITITEPTTVDATAVEDMPVSCPGGNDGQASVTATGGIAPYTYEWDANTGSQITPVATMLSGGTYLVTITDANNCTFATSVLVNEPTDPVVIIIDNTTPSNCTSCDGTASISISGGTGPYTVQWSNSDTTEDPTGLCAGINTVTVTDANGCQAIEPVNISNTSSLSIITAVINNVSCASACDGSASVTPTGGNPPYAFLWDNNQTTDIATGLCAGTHFVTVTDQDGCLSAASVDITEPTATVASAMGEALACNGDMDGNITLTVNGGTPPYTYQWDNGAGTVQNPSGLGVGTYTVTITDANSCIINASADITQSTLLTASAVGQDVNCNGGADGNITLTVNGGTLPYTFVWDNGAGTGQNPSGLSAGTYNVVITDANGCTANASATLSGPTALTASAQGEVLDCNGDTDGNITLTVNGGTAPYLFVWDNGAGTGQNPSGLSAGTYSVVVTDNNGCQVTAQASITEPTLLTASATGDDLACNGDTDGNISLTVNGGTAPYTYQWTNGAGTVQNPTGLGVGTYSVVVTDNNSCTANATATVTEPTLLTATTTGQDVSCFGLSDGQATVTANGGTAPYGYQWDNGEVSNPAVFLNTGQHDVTITDANGCQVESTVNIGTPAALIPTGLSSTPVTCFGGNDGTATIAASGGTPPYTYAWNTTPAQTGTIATNLPAGVVQVIITDANGCSLPPINITVTQPDTQVSAIMSNIEPTCNGGDDGTVSVEAAGGIPSYTYEWSTGDVGQTVFDVSAGTYTVTITDSNGCTAVESTTLGEPVPVVSSLLTTGVTCFGDENGSILVETTIGGTAPYVYSLDGENYQTSDFFGGLAGGNYTVYTEDVNGCGGSVSTIVDEPFELIVDLGADITMELGDSVQLFAQTNTLDSVSYSWTPTTGLSCTDCPDPWVTGLETTSYQVQISNANGCTATDNITITVDKNRNIYIPNVFSPTNDGTNDVFMIYGGQGVVQVDVFRVYDRWGELLWEAKDFPTDDPTYGWNGIFRGQTMNSAVFVYYAEVTFIDGLTIQYKGDVTLVR